MLVKCVALLSLSSALLKVARWASRRCLLVTGLKGVFFFVCCILFEVGLGLRVFRLPLSPFPAPLRHCSIVHGVGGRRLSILWKAVSHIVPSSTLVLSNATLGQRTLAMIDSSPLGSFVQLRHRRASIFLRHVCCWHGSRI